MRFPLLQRAPLLRLTESDSTGSTFILIVILAIVAVVTLWIVLVGARVSPKPGTYSKGSFRKRAKKLKLTKPQIKLLEIVIAEMKFANPVRVLESPATLDKLLRQAMIRMEEQDIPAEEKELRKSVIYEIKQAIEANSSQGKIISSTLILPINTEVKIRAADGKTCVSYITSNMQNMLGMEMPGALNKEGAYPWPKGEELSVMFIRGGTDVYAYKTKVLGYKNVRGVLSVFTEHGRNLKQVQKRHAKRKKIGRPAVLYMVNIVETKVKRKPVRQAVVNKARSLLGSMQDISAGGCAIMAQNVVPKGSLVQVDFETMRGKPVTVYGKVRGLTPNPPRRKIIHVQFTNVSRKNMNAIRDFVYEYDT
ncbi:MAG: PilZ domain-containing protein [Spirochaetales bacterium]|jgi:c-di-GMP-binding flagellar brake protein YcgR|nr:PilZ domain-containing protein [Spirochaetales bacterium]